MRDKERDFVRQIEDLKQLLAMKENEIERFKGQSQNVTSFSKSLEREISDLRDEVQRLNDIINNTQNDTLRTEHKKNQFEIEIIDLKKQNLLQKEDMRRLESDYAQIRKEYEDEKAKTKTIQQQNERLQSLVENLDQSKTELMKRLSSTNNEKQAESQDKAVLLKDIENYKHQLMGKEQEILDLRRSIETLDASMDDL